MSLSHFLPFNRQDVIQIHYLVSMSLRKKNCKIKFKTKISNVLTLSLSSVVAVFKISEKTFYFLQCNSCLIITIVNLFKKFSITNYYQELYTIIY